LYEVPLYKVILSGTLEIEDIKLNISSDFKAYRFGVHMEDENDNPKMVGFQEAQSYYLNWDYITTMKGFAWRVTEGWFLHKGPDDPLTQIYGSIGCIEICGKGEWNRFNDYVKWFTGSNDENEISKNKLLRINYEKAIKPNLKKK
jgi:hypothetical protein